MVEGVGMNCAGARRRAARELGLADHDAPPCDLIEEAAKNYLRLFRPGHAGVLKSLREEAARAMRFLQDFEPRLVGSVLAGTADSHSVITLHLFADAPEEVMFHLLNHAIPFREGERAVRYRDGSVRSYPLYSFIAGGRPFDLVVMPEKALREAPAGVGEGGGMERASLRKLERLIAGMREAEA